MSIDLIEKAQRIVGNGKPDEDRITPTLHADVFEKESPEFAAILRSSHVGVTAKDYEEKDQTAIDAQCEFDTSFNRSNLMVLSTSTIIVLLILAGIFFPNWKIMVSLGVLSFVSGFGASYYLNLIRQGRLLENRRLSRARAEAARLEYFISIARYPDQWEVGPLMDLLKLEYFRRFQLDVQNRYYVNSSKKNSKLWRKDLKLSSMAIGGAGTIAAFAGFAGGFIGARYAAVATIGTLFTAINTFATTREDVQHHQRNAERYARTKDALVEIYKTIDYVRAAVAKDGEKPLMDFIDAVHEQLLAEHKQWLKLEEESENAFTKLQDTLNKSLNTLPARPGEEPRLPKEGPQKSAGGPQKSAGRAQLSSGPQSVAGGPHSDAGGTDVLN